MTPERAHRCLEPGLSILVGAAGADGSPVCCRAIAVASDDALATLTVYVPVATSHEMLQSVAATKRLAVTANHPATNCSTQLKGTAIEARLARDEEAPFVRARLDAFADMLDALGVPRRIAHSLAHWPAFAIRMRIDQIFEQTPGPKAGTQIR